MTGRRSDEQMGAELMRALAQPAPPVPQTLAQRATQAALASAALRTPVLSGELVRLGWRTLLAASALTAVLGVVTVQRMAVPAGGSADALSVGTAGGTSDVWGQWQAALVATPSSSFSVVDTAALPGGG